MTPRLGVVACVVAVTGAACGDDRCAPNDALTRCERDGEICGAVIWGTPVDTTRACVRHDERMILGCDAVGSVATTDIGCATYDGPTGSGIVVLSTGSWESSEAIEARGGTTPFELTPCNPIVEREVSASPACD